MPPLCTQGPQSCPILLFKAYGHLARILAHGQSAKLSNLALHLARILACTQDHKVLQSGLAPGPHTCTRSLRPCTWPAYLSSCCSSSSSLSAPPLLISLPTVRSMQTSVPVRTLAPDLLKYPLVQIRSLPKYHLPNYPHAQIPFCPNKV